MTAETPEAAAAEAAVVEAAEAVTAAPSATTRQSRDALGEHDGALASTTLLVVPAINIHHQ